MSYPIMSFKDSGAESNRVFGDPSHGSITSSERTHDILTKKVAAFWPCPETLPEVKLKSTGLIPLMKRFQDSLK